MSRPRALELAVLGLVWKTGPCTPYAIRQVFLDSPSSHWSGSAGAIYPLVARLEVRGLLRSRPMARGGRRGRAYTLTPAGLRQLRGWLSALVTPEDASVSYDPIRTRLLFLGALPRVRRRAVLAAAAARLRAEVRVARKVLMRERRSHDPHDAHAALGALMVLEARTRWVTGLLAGHHGRRRRARPRAGGAEPRAARLRR